MLTFYVNLLEFINHHHRALRGLERGLLIYKKMHIKDFDKWNEKKKQLHKEAVNLLYHQEEIWWCHLGINIGFEEDGTGDEAERPVVIVRRFNSQLCWVIPLTTSQKKNPYYFYAGNVDGVPASVILSQMRPVDTKRLINLVGVMDHKIFYPIKQAVRALL
jgi:mRNA-degrading endonuclease toxin of MazEF toxin-antitoxin module